ncbi:short transient receptor potential channel 4-associated protein-like [Limulus polyphemus]|uniref:Short transient receptor potential channel 4-associated protein-like n=1 Tax=Limulus polyphemus TaxID=6850 RepID=A0ABM1BMT9_LIMPO|nr:short transient receptor potential channel 4-associated protein-like [Limulus polyphemus]
MAVRRLLCRGSSASKKPFSEFCVTPSMYGLAMKDVLGLTFVPEGLLLSELDFEKNIENKNPNSPAQFLQDYKNYTKCLKYLNDLNKKSFSISCIDDDYPSSIQMLKWMQDELMVSPSSYLLNDIRQTKSKSVIFKLFADFSGAVNALIRFVLSFMVFPPEKANLYQTNKALCLRGLCLEILHCLCIQCESVAQNLSEYESIFETLLNLIQFSQTSLPASQLLECLFLSCKKPVNFLHIPNLGKLVESFNDFQLGNFCRILTVTLSDLDFYAQTSSLYAQHKEKKKKNLFSKRDENQNAVLNMPGILSRLVQLVCAKPYVPQFPRSFSSFAVSEVNHWLQWIELNLENEVIHTSEMNESTNFVGGISRSSTSGEAAFSFQSSLAISSEMTIRAHGAYVLGLLLVGKHRKEVQQKLAELCLIPKLSDLFDHFTWECGRSSSRLHNSGHFGGCDCNPGIALKTQVMRLVHSFCDHSEYKHVMLSWSECSELFHSNSNDDLPKNVKKSLMCVGSKGLLSKIVDVLKKEPKNSSFRFWFSRAIESFLRDCATSHEQDFLIRRNLLHHLFENLLSVGRGPKEVIQSSFDLLAELVKFNYSAIRHLDKPLRSEEKWQTLLAIINRNLVDSNMFLRSMILSREHLRESCDKDIIDYVENHSHLLLYFGRFQTRLSYLKRLISIISVENLTQESVSCLNTSLIILITAHRNGQLSDYLQAMKPSSCLVSTESDEFPFQGLLENFRELLLFWKEHYLHKDKDCYSLEKSSRIVFKEWEDLVSLLLKEDSSNAHTLLFHMKTSVSYRSR